MAAKPDAKPKGSWTPEEIARNERVARFAVSAHGHVRPSKDLDIVPDPGPENLKR
jgi:hypothetical protein